MIWPDASDVHVELTFEMHDLDDNGVVEEHEARKVINHTPILKDLLKLASELWDVLDVNDDGKLDFEELINIYQVFYTIDFTEDELNEEEAFTAFEIFRTLLGGELSQEALLKFMRSEIAKAAGGAMAVAH